jgi:hypothetical protein
VISEMQLIKPFLKVSFHKFQSENQEMRWSNWFLNIDEISLFTSLTELIYCLTVLLKIE